MDDTDKKIAEIERELCVYDYGIDKEDAEWLIDELKECRERENKPLLAVRDKLDIEHRMKQACFKAGWDWIIRMIGLYPISDEILFKEAIFEAKGE